MANKGSMKASDLIQEVIQAHGGRERWQAVEVIKASLFSGGLAFALHWQPFALCNLKIAVSPHARARDPSRLWPQGLVRLLDSKPRANP